MTSLALVVEHLRRAVPGGIGRYTECLRTALQQHAGITLHAIDGSPFPTGLVSRAWEVGVPVPTKASILHAPSFALPRTLPARPTTMFIHDVLWQTDGAQALNDRGRRFHERGLRRARTLRHLFVPAGSVASELIRLGFARKNITVTGEGCDHLRILPRNVGEPYLLSVGTFQPRKNLGLLLAAYEQLRTSAPEVPPLKLVGSDQWRGVNGLPSSLPAGVSVEPNVDDVRLAELYAGATAFIFPSLAEGYGLPPLEALRAGVPTVCSPMPSVCEHIDAGSVAPTDSPVELIDPTDVSSLVSGLRRVLESEDRQAELAAQGHAWAAARTWAAMAERHVAVWEAL